jgi:hypothetical protein
VEEMNEEVLMMEDLRKIYSHNPVAVVKQGRDGSVIGVVEQGSMDVEKGMIVIFSRPPTQLIGKKVYLINYEVRDSQKTGKKYVKCFQYIDADTLLKALMNEAAKEISAKLRLPFDKLSRALELVSTNPAEASRIIVDAGADVVAYDNNSLFIYKTPQLVEIKIKEFDVTYVEELFIDRGVDYFYADYLTEVEVEASPKVIKLLPGLKIWKKGSFVRYAVIVPKNSREEKLMRYMARALKPFVNLDSEINMFPYEDIVLELVEKILRNLSSGEEVKSNKQNT